MCASTKTGTARTRLAHLVWRSLVGPAAALVAVALFVTPTLTARADGACVDDNASPAGEALTLIGKTYAQAETEVRNFYTERYPRSADRLAFSPDLFRAYPKVDPNQIRVRGWSCVDDRTDSPPPYRVVVFLIEASAPDLRGLTAGAAGDLLAQRGLRLAVSTPQAPQDWLIRTQSVVPEVVLAWTDDQNQDEPTITVALGPVVSPTTPPEPPPIGPIDSSTSAAPEISTEPGPSVDPGDSLDPAISSAVNPNPPGRQDLGSAPEYGLLRMSVVLPTVALAVLGLVFFFAFARWRRDGVRPWAWSSRRRSPVMADIHRYRPTPHTWLELDGIRPAPTVGLVARADPGTPTLREGWS